MANAIYPLYKQALLAGDANADLDNDTADDGPYVVLIDTGVTGLPVTPNGGDIDVAWHASGIVGL